MLNFLYDAVSWVLLLWHKLFTAVGIDKDSGVNWTLSIVFLVITARLLLFRVIVKQVHYQRRMQEMQPRMQQIRAKYKDDKAEMNRQMMKLQQDEGFNPLAGCLPMFLQIPVFIGLLHVLRHLSNSVSLPKTSPKLKLYGFSSSETLSAAKAKIFGAPLAASLRDSTQTIEHTLGGHASITRVVIIVLVLVSAAATVGTQVMLRSNMTTVPEGTAATMQRLMIWLIPVGVLFSGLFFPLGVLMYWFISNTWTLGQQAYIIRYHPHTPAQAPPSAASGRAVVPKVGQKPDRQRGRVSTPAGAGDVIDVEPVEADTAPPKRTSPPPGARPNRPGNNRPASKRPTQAKKRR